MNRELQLKKFGDPILRQVARRLTSAEIKSPDIQRLITDMRDLNEVKRYGVGLAAPQVGVSVALAIIGIKPTPNHPEFGYFERVIINPAYEGIGRRSGMWEGCQSTGRDSLYGKTLRFKRIRARWLDEAGAMHDEELKGFVAHVFQHETDHLEGILFVDRVRDAKSFMLASEYRKRVIERQ